MTEWMGSAWAPTPCPVSSRLQAAQEARRWTRTRLSLLPFFLSILSPPSHTAHHVPSFLPLPHIFSINPALLRTPQRLLSPPTTSLRLPTPIQQEPRPNTRSRPPPHPSPSSRAFPVASGGVQVVQSVRTLISRATGNGVYRPCVAARQSHLSCLFRRHRVRNRIPRRSRPQQL